MKFKVTFTELISGKEHVCERTCSCESRQQIIDFYGLNEPDIVSYHIEAVE